MIATVLSYHEGGPKVEFLFHMMDDVERNEFSQKLILLTEQKVLKFSEVLES